MPATLARRRARHRVREAIPPGAADGTAGLQAPLPQLEDRHHCGVVRGWAGGPRSRSSAARGGNWAPRCSWPWFQIGFRGHDAGHRQVFRSRGPTTSWASGARISASAGSPTSPRAAWADLAEVDGRAFRHADLVSGGVPCPRFSIAGKQLGNQDQRDLFPQTLRLIEQASPRAVLLENVPRTCRTPVRRLPDPDPAVTAFPGISDLVGPGASQRTRRAPAAPQVRAGGDQTTMGGPVQLARAIGAAGHSRRGARASDGLGRMAGRISLVAPGRADRPDDRRPQHQAWRAGPGPDPGLPGLEGPRRRQARHRRPRSRTRPSRRPAAKADGPYCGAATRLGWLKAQMFRLQTVRARSSHGMRDPPNCTPRGLSVLAASRARMERSAGHDMRRSS
jgi:hypothetical protein